MKEAFTIEEFKALLRFAFESGQISGKYEDSTPGHREDIKLKGFYPSFEDWYIKEIDPKNR